MKYGVNFHVTCAAIAVASLGLEGCASSIDRSSEIRSQRLQVGSATKNDVVRAIGLPRNVVVDPKNGCETWFYVGVADFSAAFVPMPTYIGPNSATGTMVRVGASSAPKDATFIAIFDKSAHLIEIQQPQPSKPQ